MESTVIYAIGYPKAGSSALRSLLSGGDVNYIYNPDLTNLLYGIPPLVSYDEDASVDHYRSKLSLLLTSGVNIIGDETLMGLFYSGHYNYREIASRIKKAHPEAKIIISIREQGKILYSSYKHYISRGGVLSFSDWANKGGSKRVPGFTWRCYQYAVVHRFYSDLFGIDNVLMIPIELRNSNPEEYFDLIIEFIGVKLDMSVLSKKNQGISDDRMLMKRFMNIFNPNSDYDDTRDRTPLTSNICYYLAFPVGLLILLYAKFFVRNISDKLCVENLIELYREDNRELQDAIGIDLGALGYRLSNVATKC